MTADEYLNRNIIYRSDLGTATKAVTFDDAQTAVSLAYKEGVDYGFKKCKEIMKQRQRAASEAEQLS